MHSESFYGEVLADHNLHPIHKHDLQGADFVCKGLNPTCGDDIVISVDIENGVITDCAFSGMGCAISQASADIMCELIIGKTPAEARHYTELFHKMISGEINDEQLEELEEAGALQKISKMPARVKCATLSWNTLDKILNDMEES